MKTTKTLFTALICSFVFSLTAPSSISFGGRPFFLQMFMQLQLMLHLQKSVRLRTLLFGNIRL